MADRQFTRRDVLKRAGAAGAGAVAATGSAGAHGAPRRIVGTSSRAGVREARRRAAEVAHVHDFDEIGQAVAGRFSDEAVEQLRRRSDVRYVEADVEMHAIHHREGHDGGPGGGGGGGGGGGSTSERLPWGVDRVDAEVAHSNGDTGDGAHVAIIDTGIDDDHPDLQANVGAGRAFTKCKGSNCNYDWSDDNDHGTHCSGIADGVDDEAGVIGVATQATLHAVKVLDRDGSGYLSDVAAGIEYTADQGWDVGSLSLGASSGGQTLQDACSYAYDKGVTLVAAAGNDGPCADCVGYPAAYDEVIAVSATASDDSLASFSSTGAEVELAAPGESIYSTVVGGYDTFSGTSMACPHVAGAAAQLMANGYANAEARSRLRETAEDLGLTSNEQGNGLLDAAAALGHDSTDD